MNGLKSLLNIPNNDNRNIRISASDCSEMSLNGDNFDIINVFIDSAVFSGKNPMIAETDRTSRPLLSIKSDIRNLPA